MNKKFLSAILFGALMVTSTGTFVSCKDYDDDIENLQTQIDANKSAIAALQSKVDAGKYITSVTTTAEGLTIALNDGTSYKVTNGKDGATGEAGAAGTQITVGEDGFWYFDGEKSEYKATCTAEDVKVDVPYVGEDGYWYFFNEEGEAVKSEYKAMGAAYAVEANGIYTLYIPDANGAMESIKLPSAGSTLQDVELLGTAVVNKLDQNLSMGESQTLETIVDELTVGYAYVAKIIKKYDGDKETTWSAQKEVKKGQVLTTLSPLNQTLLARIDAGADAADMSFTLKNSKGATLPISLGAPAQYKGLLTRGAAGMYVLTMDVTADTYTSASKYTEKYSTGLYALVEKSGFVSNYALNVTPEAVEVEQQDVVAIYPAGTVATAGETGNGSERDPFIIDLNTPATLVFGEKPELVYDYYVEPVDANAAKEFGFSTDKAKGTITMTKSADLVSKAGLQLNVYALHLNGAIYRSQIWVKPSSILSSSVVLKAGEQTIAPILTSAGIYDTANEDEMTFKVSLADMFSAMSATEKDRWTSAVLGANAADHVVVKAEAAYETPAAANFDIVRFVKSNGWENANNTNAAYMEIHAKYAAENADGDMVAILTPNKEYTLTVNFMHDDNTVLNTVKVTFTPVLPELSGFITKRTAVWNDDASVLMAYFDDPAANDQATLESVYDIADGGFTKFGKVDKNNVAIATITLGLDGNQVLYDDKYVVAYKTENGETVIDEENSLAVIDENVIELNTTIEDANGKVRSYAEELNVLVAVDYLGVYNYKENDALKAELAEQNFKVNVQSALVAGYIKALEGSSIVMEPAAAGELWKVTSKHVGGYTYSDQAYSLFKVLNSDGDAVYKYTYIESVKFDTPDKKLYTVVKADGETVTTEAIEPTTDADGNEVASYVALKPGNTTQETKTTLNVKVTDKFGYTKYVEVPLTINKAKK